MKRTFVKKALSILLAAVLAFTTALPAFSAFAGDGVSGYYDLQIFYSDTDTIVPTYEEDGETPFVVYMIEGDELQLKYKLIDSVFPDSGYIKWYSEAPALADVDQTGKVKAFDSSKGAVIHLWIDNEVKTIPIIGKPVASLIEKAFFNEYVDLDSMDTDEIVSLLEKTLGSNSIIAEQIESYQGDLIDSLRTYLDKVNSNIHCVLYNKEGEVVADDVIKVVVKKNEEWYAAFLPNGTHITNKSQIPDTVAKGSQVQLYAITTPQRLNFGTVYSVKSSSIFTQGKVVATVDDSGLVKFKNVGKTTIMASPDSEDVIEGLLKFINYFYTLENTGTIDSTKAADILIKYIGIDINRTVLAGILDACFAISDIVGDTADPVQLTATAVEIIANLTLQFVYNDTIDFEVVPSKPLESFEIEGVNTVKEGRQIQLVPTKIVPEVGDTTDIIWESSDPSIACVEKDTGIVTGLDAGGSLGELSSQTCTITAISTTNDVRRTFTITVTGKTGKYLSKVDIKGKDIVGIEDTENYTYTVYPARVSDSENLYIKWGMVGPEDESGNPTYIWADSENPAVDPDGVGQIDSNGHFTPLNGGKCTIALEAKTGYLLSDGSFYQISAYTATKQVETGIPVEKIDIDVAGTIGGSLGRKETVTINGKDYYYCTNKIGVGNAYNGKGVTVNANVYPENATDQNLTWVVNNSNFNQTLSADTHTIDVALKPANEYTQKFDIYAVSADGEIASNVVTVCITRNYASANTINEEAIELINGKSTEAHHTLTFEGTWDSSAYACYDANWYSSDEEIFTVRNMGNDNSDAVIEAHDVGVATLYCVSADGGIVDTIDVTVKPDKQQLAEIVDLCDKTVVLRTKFNQNYYKDYMKKLDLAYIVLYEEDMASQTVVDTTAANLLAAFTKVGGFVGISSLEIKATGGTPLAKKYVTVGVGSTKNYKNYSYDFDYKVNPVGAMFSRAEWSSSNDSIKVDENGVCTPTSNDPCSADITCTVVDYNGNRVSDVVHVAFARTKAEGVELDTYEINEAKIGETHQLSPKVLPKNFLGNSTASVGAVTYRSTNTNVATVDENGLITFVYGGTAKIIVTTADGGYTAECVVTVTTNYDRLELLCKQYDDLNLKEVSYYPETWQPYIEAKTEAEQMIAQKGYTQEEVDAQYDKLHNAYLNLKKFVNIQKVELYLDGEQTSEFYQYDLRLLREGLSYKNAKLDLEVRLYPNNATYQKAEWFSSTDMISVSSDGVCSPTSNKPCYGQIECVVTDSFGEEFRDTVWVSFSYNPVTGVQLSKDSIVGAIGTTEKLTATILPTGTSLGHIAAADIQDYFWESDDEKVATVDQDGTVHFVGAGSTIVRCVSYDGGVSGECQVSSEGDRTALKATIEKYKDTDFTEYEYIYGSAFKDAYDAALLVLDDRTKTQKEIDDATGLLELAGQNLEGHPYIHVETININYEAFKRSLTGNSTSQAQGPVGANNAVSINLSNGYSNYNDYNDIVLTPTAYPSNAMYKTVTWEIIENQNMNTAGEASHGFKLTPAKRSEGTWARVKVVYTDHYGKTASREVWVTMSDTVCTGITVTPESYTLLGSDDPYQLNVSTTGSGDGYNSKVFYTSDNEEVATVSSTGVVTPVDAGTCTITAKTLDGGYTKTVSITVVTDFSKLAAKVTEYEELINNVKDSDQYTEESLRNLSEQVENGKAIVNAGKANQREVNAALRALEAAYAQLVGYIPATGIKVSLNDTQTSISEVNPGYIRLQNTALNGAVVQLKSTTSPEDGMYESIEWSSTNENITVDSDGKVTNTTALPGYAIITATITTAYGDKYYDSVVVSFVRYGVTGVTFGSTLVYGAPNKQKQIPVTLTCDSNLEQISPSVTDCMYTSMDESIATVNADGYVKFVSQGVTTIRVTSLDGGYVGNISVQTTWDTSALEEAIAQASALNYQDYEKEYGIMLLDDLESARTVYNNPNASQAEIDAACKKLTETLSVLEEHRFVLPVVTMKVGDETVVNGATFEAVNNSVRIDVDVAGNMFKTFELATDNLVNCTSQINDRIITISKTELGTNATLTVSARVVDDYDRETTYTYNITIVDELVYISSIYITLDGEQVTSVAKTGCGMFYTSFKSFQLAYATDEIGVADPVSVQWTSTNSDYITVDSNGIVDLTPLGKGKAVNTTNISCTVTNADGSTVTAKIPVTIQR